MIQLLSHSSERPDRSDRNEIHVILKWIKIHYIFVMSSKRFCNTLALHIFTHMHELHEYYTPSLVRMLTSAPALIRVDTQNPD